MRKAETDSTVYLLGANKNRVCVDLAVTVSLQRYTERDERKDEREGGCEFMNSVSGQSMAKAYIKLARKGLTPVAIANVNNDTNHMSTDWGHDYGGAIRANPGIVFITYGATFTEAVVNDEGIKKVEVCVVSEDFNKRTKSTKQKEKP
jgi:hypothetical protein